MLTAPTMVMTNAIRAESSGASARTSRPHISSPLEPPRAFARRPRLHDQERGRPDYALAAERPLSGHEHFKIELRALTRR
jgi:hypothetical protein